MNRTVADVMETSEIVVHPDHPVSEAVERMHDAGAKVLAVVDGDEIVGLLRMDDIEQDPDAASPEASVRDEMRAEVRYCFADDPVEAAIGVMEKTGFADYLVVDREKRLLGHVSLSALKQGASGRTEAGSSASRGDIAARTQRGGGRKRGENPHEPKSFSSRPVIRD